MNSIVVSNNFITFELENYVIFMTTCIFLSCKSNNLHKQTTRRSELLKTVIMLITWFTYQYNITEISLLWYISTIWEYLQNIFKSLFTSFDLAIFQFLSIFSWVIYIYFSVLSCIFFFFTFFWSELTSFKNKIWSYLYLEVMSLCLCI